MADQPHGLYRLNTLLLLAKTQFVFNCRKMDKSSPWIRRWRLWADTFGAGLCQSCLLALPGFSAERVSRSSQLNLSLLLQCLVLSLPQPLPSLQDSRVQAAIAINPLDSAVFGSDGLANIKTPIMIVSGSADTVTPALAEQIRPFAWLESPERYLLIMEGGTHFSAIHNPQAVEESTPTPEAAIGPSPELAQRYVKAISLAFFKVYLAQEDFYRQYLTPSYTAALSQPDIPLSLIRELTLED